MDFVENLRYTGLTIVFLGGAKLFKEGDSNGSAEFDGLVVCPTINPKEVFGYIIEAKNYNNGVTEAKRQLKKRVGIHLLQNLTMEVKELNDRAAFAEIKLKV